MKSRLLLIIALLPGAACKHQNTEAAGEKDSIVSVTDSVVEKVEVQVVMDPAPAIVHSSTGELITEDGEAIFVSKDQYSFIYNPYDFSLDTATIEGLLGECAKTKSESFEAGEDYSAYTYYTVSCGDSKMSFYDFEGKHFADINTPLLPLKYGIKVGMKKNDFLTAVGFDSVAVANANRYRLTDDYGKMEFYFRADSLYRIYAHYEEGD